MKMRILTVMAACMVSILGFAQKAPKGHLTECSWSSMSMLPGKGGYAASFVVSEGQSPTLTMTGRYDEDKYVIDEAEVSNLEKLIKKKKVYKVDGYKEMDPSGKAPEYRIFLKYDNGEVYSARWSTLMPSEAVSNALSTIQEFFEKLTHTYPPLPKVPGYIIEGLGMKVPTGKMTYCSCAETNFGLPAGEVQKRYYELIADEGAAPKVVFCEIREESQKTEYPATEQDVSDLYNQLRDMNVFQLHGYDEDEQSTGGTGYRIHMEFSTGEKFNATWITHNPKDLAVRAYSTILSFLRGVTKR